MENPTVEECLRQIEDRAAMLRYFADSVAGSPNVPDARVFAGLGDVFAEIETMTRAARRSLDVAALGTAIRRSR